MMKGWTSRMVGSKSWARIYPRSAGLVFVIHLILLSPQASCRHSSSGNRKFPGPNRRYPAGYPCCPLRQPPLGMVAAKRPGWEAATES